MLDQSRRLKTAFCLILWGIVWIFRIQSLAAIEGVATQPGNSLSLQASPERLIVEVVALDRKGNPVRNLKKKDFKLYEDGKKQDIAGIEEVNSEAAASAAGGDLLPCGKIVVKFFTDIHPEYMKTACDSAANFIIKSMRPHDYFAVIGGGYGHLVLQDLTRDREKVLTALRTFPVLKSRGGAPISLDKINKALAGIQGRKSILLYTHSGFPPLGLPSHYNQSIGEVGDDFYEKTLRSAKLSNVVFYTINPQTLNSDSGSFGYSMSGARSLAEVSETAPSITLMRHKQTLRTLAAGSGGYSISPSTDDELEKLARQISNYYVLNYQSNNPKNQKAFRKLRIKTKAAGVTLKYQSVCPLPRSLEKGTTQIETLISSIDFSE